MKHSILLVEDDKDLQEVLRDFLLDYGFYVVTASDGVTALKEIKKLPPDLIILDLNLPIMGGETVCVEAKKMYPDVPIIILTAKDSTADVVRGLEDLGADDYIAKPFETEELLARIKARLRKGGNNSSRLEIADLILDTKTLEVKRGDKKIELTPQEFKLLEYLMSNKGKVMTRDAILNRVWLYSPDIETRVVDVYVGYLRKKIDEGFDKPLIHSVRGFGYVVREED